MLNTHVNMIAKTDRDKSVVILSIQDCDKKINNFIIENLIINTDPTNSFKTVRKIANTGQTIIPQ
jgi:hypothetical protein